jgi:hypothetical protein
MRTRGAQIEFGWLTVSLIGMLKDLVMERLEIIPFNVLNNKKTDYNENYKHDKNWKTCTLCTGWPSSAVEEHKRGV